MGSVGVFGVWQPRYEEMGIPTFPVDNKRPAIRNFLKIGMDGSRSFVDRFGDCTGIGVPLKRAGITVVDVDTPDERVLADALSRYGRTPLIVRSGSGNHQAWYRSSGEGRSIRPDKAVPIDILGDGFVVAPPSIGGKGRYQIIHGSLADLESLPPIANAPTAPCEVASATHKAVPIGERNDTLFRRLMQQARYCDDLDALMDVARLEAEALYPPLPDTEIIKTARSAFGYQQRGENWCGVGQRVVMTHDVIDGLMMADNDAFIMLTLLRRHHWGRDFVIANALADKLGWSLSRVRRARKSLVDRGLVEEVRANSSFHGAALYRFKGC